MDTLGNWKKIKILGAVWELPDKQRPIWPNFEVNGLDWQCCLAGSSQRAPRIFIFLIAMGADYSFYVKTIETHACTFLTLNILAISRVKKAPSEIILPHCVILGEGCCTLLLHFIPFLEGLNLLNSLITFDA